MIHTHDVGEVPGSRATIFDGHIGQFLFHNEAYPLALPYLKYAGSIPGHYANLPSDQRTGLSPIRRSSRVVRHLHACMDQRGPPFMDQLFAIEREINSHPAAERLAVLRSLPRRRACVHDQQFVERALCGLALRREAWFFAGSNRGSQRTAFFDSPIVAAKLNDVDPQARMADVFGRTASHPA